MAHPLTERYRAQQAGLRRQVLAALRQVWPTLDPDRLDETFPGWAVAVGAVVRRNRALSAGLASRYVALIRAASGVPGLPPPVTPPDLPAPVLGSSLAVTGPVAIKKAVARGVPLDEAVRNAFVLSSQSAHRHVLNAGREVVLRSVSEDPAASGWRRVTSGRSCGFCDSLAQVYPPGRGDFEAHDGCGCSVEPVYR